MNARPEGLILALLLVVASLAIVEGLVRHFVLHRPYDWRACAASLADAAGRRVLEATGLSLLAPLFVWLYAHRLGTINIDGPAALAALFFAEELAYYAYHRAAHRVRWFWATHAVHHSPNELTWATALRLGWTGRITGTGLFFAPLVWLGFSPQAVAAALAFNLLYQFWLHSSWIPKLGPLEWVLNTPSHHRVHHGSNPEYLDCNYGGVVIVFDRLFGSFVAEREDLPPRYGLTTPLLTNNPLRIAFHEWANLARDLRRARTPRQLLQTLLGPPQAAHTVKASPGPLARSGAPRNT